MKTKHLNVIVLLAVILSVGPMVPVSANDTIKPGSGFINDPAQEITQEDLAEVKALMDQVLQDREKTNKPSKTTPVITELMPVFVFLFILLIVYIPFYFNYRKIRGRQQTINKCIEKGVDIPADLLSPPKSPTRSDFHKGLILISLGLGIVLALIALKIENNFWTLGLIPVFIGAGYMISHKYDKHHDRT